MGNKKILDKLNINPQKVVLSMSGQEALENLLETIEEYCPDLKLEELSAEDMEILLKTYADCVIAFHPENSHQERAALSRNFEMLKKYGMTDGNYKSMDFC